MGRSNVRQRVVVCCWGVSWSFGSLATHGNPVGRNKGDVNGRDQCAIFGRWVLARTCGVLVVRSDLAYVAITLRCRVWCTETWSVGT